jgi:hypothetical protein
MDDQSVVGYKKLVIIRNLNGDVIHVSSPTMGIVWTPVKDTDCYELTIKTDLVDYYGIYALYDRNDVELDHYCGVVVQVTAGIEIASHEKGWRAKYALTEPLTGLKSTNLQRANLIGADLRGADLEKAELGRADLREADLRGANLRGANLWEADLQRANLRGANLWGADLQRADLQRANLWGADLQRTNLRGANLTNVIDYSR